MPSLSTEIFAAAAAARSAGADWPGARLRDTAADRIGRLHTRSPNRGYCRLGVVMEMVRGLVAPSVTSRRCFFRVRSGLELKESVRDRVYMSGGVLERQLIPLKGSRFAQVTAYPGHVVLR